MDKLLNYLKVWKESKITIFKSENYQVLDEENGNEIFLILTTEKLLAKATIHISGKLILDVTDMVNNNIVIQETIYLGTVREFDDKLNWWLSEIAIY